MRFKKLLYSASKIALKSDVKDDSLNIKTNKKISIAILMLDYQCCIEMTGMNPNYYWKHSKSS